MEAAAGSELDRSLFMNSDSDRLQSVILSLIVDKCPVIEFRNRQGTGPPMAKSGGPMKSNLSRNSDAGTGNIVGVERDLESSAYKKQGIGPNANMPLGELEDQHVERIHSTCSQRGEGISFLQRKKNGADLTRHNLTIHPIPMICA
ncbi:unnamed protein product [Cuscuta campestris]|uniref:Uncharacterized protein n=1 Tax=Cuscuta campestris TaxID=132261 RepID=A0A484MK21_9ASTE|nr:unnamed protein product [Cuscuta campestris]